MRAIAVVCCRSLTRSVRDERVALRLEPDKPALPALGCRKRVVATSGQDHELEIGHAVDLIEYGIERDGLQIDIPSCGQGRIYGNEKIASSNLDAVAAEIDHAELGSNRLARDVT